MKLYLIILYVINSFMYTSLKFSSNLIRFYAYNLFLRNNNMKESRKDKVLK